MEKTTKETETQTIIKSLEAIDSNIARLNQDFDTLIEVISRKKRSLANIIMELEKPKFYKTKSALIEPFPNLVMPSDVWLQPDTSRRVAPKKPDVIDGFDYGLFSMQ